MLTSDQPEPYSTLAARRSADDGLLAELTASPSLVEEAQDALAFWQARVEQLPVYRRAERQKARERIQRWERCVRDSLRARYGPSLIEQTLDALGIQWRPNRPGTARSR